VGEVAQIRKEHRHQPPRAARLRCPRALARGLANLSWDQVQRRAAKTAKAKWSGRFGPAGRADLIHAAINN
jgi:hypothetical protein